MNTDTTTIHTAGSDVEAAAGEQIVQIPIDRIDPHPDNVRSNPGEGLADLTRSIKANGVLQPVVVLPADSDGGTCSSPATAAASPLPTLDVGTLPAIVRDLDPLQVLDLMYEENAQRASLSMTDTIRAVARYQALDPKATRDEDRQADRAHPGVGQGPPRRRRPPGDVLDLLNDGTMSLAAVPRWRRWPTSATTPYAPAPSTSAPAPVG